MKLDTMMWLLLVIFMFHEFEEIIMMKPWITKNKSHLRQRFPVFTSRLFPHFERLSASSISLIIAIEFLMVSALIYSAVEFELYPLWTSFLLIFTFHLIFHIISFMLYRKYVPVIVTSIITIPYCLYTLYSLKNNHIEFVASLFRWLVVVAMVGAIIFACSLWLATCFEKWLNKNYGVN
jgi:hypothetical protein